jgi:hypothetical protein
VLHPGPRSSLPDIRCLHKIRPHRPTRLSSPICSIAGNTPRSIDRPNRITAFIPREPCRSIEPSAPTTRQETHRTAADHCEICSHRHKCSSSMGPAVNDIVSAFPKNARRLGSEVFPIMSLPVR